MHYSSFIMYLILSQKLLTDRMCIQLIWEWHGQFLVKFYSLNVLVTHASVMNIAFVILAPYEHHPTHVQVGLLTCDSSFGRE